MPGTLSIHRSDIMSVRSSPQSDDSFFSNQPASQPPREFVEYQNVLLRHANKSKIAFALARNFYVRRAAVEREEQARRMRENNMVDLTTDDFDQVESMKLLRQPVRSQSPVQKGNTSRKRQLSQQSRGTVSFPAPEQPILATHNYEWRVNLGRSGTEPIHDTPEPQSSPRKKFRYDVSVRVSRGEESITPRKNQLTDFERRRSQGVFSSCSPNPTYSS